VVSGYTLSTRAKERVHRAENFLLRLDPDTPRLLTPELTRRGHAGKHQPCLPSWQCNLKVNTKPNIWTTKEKGVIQNSFPTGPSVL